MTRNIEAATPEESAEILWDNHKRGVAKGRENPRASIWKKIKEIIQGGGTAIITYVPPLARGEHPYDDKVALSYLARKDDVPIEFAAGEDDDGNRLSVRKYDPKNREEELRQLAEKYLQGETPHVAPSKIRDMLRLVMRGK